MGPRECGARKIASNSPGLYDCVFLALGVSVLFLLFFSNIKSADVAAESYFGQASRFPTPTTAADGVKSSS